MYANSLVGAILAVGEPMTLQHITSSTYSTVTGAPSITTASYPVMVTTRNVNAEDMKRLGEELAKQATAMFTVPGGQLPAGIEPVWRDRFVDGTTIYEVVRVWSQTARGVPVQWVCAVTGH